MTLLSHPLRCLSASKMPHTFVCARHTPICREVGWRARPLTAVRSRVTQHSPSRLLTGQSAERARGLAVHYRAASRGLGRCVGRQRWQHGHGPFTGPGGAEIPLSSVGPQRPLFCRGRTRADARRQLLRGKKPGRS